MAGQGLYFTADDVAPAIVRAPHIRAEAPARPRLIGGRLALSGRTYLPALPGLADLPEPFLPVSGFEP